MSPPPGTHRRPRVWPLVSAAWLGPAILAAFQAYVQARLAHEPPSWAQIAWQGGDWLIYALLTPAVFWMARRYPLSHAALARRVSLHLVAAVLLCAAWSSAGIGLSHLLLHASPYGTKLTGWFLTSLPFGVAVYFAVLGVEHATFYFFEVRQRETQAARLSAQLAEARLGALRMQMQPHFLLNSLNAITVIVRDQDTATATRMLDHLGDILRRVVRTDRPPEVPLAEELELVRQILAIEEIRFADRLQAAFAVDPALLRAAVPEFVLQPLVENALRHGLARRVGVTQLRIEARREGDELVLIVTDEGAPPEGAPEEGTGVGLANTRERLATLYGERAQIVLALTTTGGTAATIRLPYRELSRVEPLRG
jgi:two-component system, LytTR family, sensor kinase